MDDKKSFIFTESVFYFPFDSPLTKRSTVYTVSGRLSSMEGIYRRNLRKPDNLYFLNQMFKIWKIIWQSFNFATEFRNLKNLTMFQFCHRVSQPEKSDNLSILQQSFHWHWLWVDMLLFRKKRYGLNRDYLKQIPLLVRFWSVRKIQLFNQILSLLIHELHSLSLYLIHLVSCFWPLYFHFSNTCGISVTVCNPPVVCIFWHTW